MLTGRGGETARLPTCFECSQLRYARVRLRFGSSQRHSERSRNPFGAFETFACSQTRSEGSRNRSVWSRQRAACSREASSGGPTARSVLPKPIRVVPITRSVLPKSFGWSDSTQVGVPTARLRVVRQRRSVLPKPFRVVPTARSVLSKPFRVVPTARSVLERLASIGTQRRKRTFVSLGIRQRATRSGFAADARSRRSVSGALRIRSLMDPSLRASVLPKRFRGALEPDPSAPHTPVGVVILPVPSKETSRFAFVQIGTKLLYAPARCRTTRKVWEHMRAVGTTRKRFREHHCVLSGPPEAASGAHCVLSGPPERLRSTLRVIGPPE